MTGPERMREPAFMHSVGMSEPEHTQSSRTGIYSKGEKNMAKTYNEMTEFEKKRHSLSVKTARLAIVSGVILIIVALVIGLSIYTGSLIRQYTRHAFDIANYAHMSVTRGSADSVGLAE